METVNQKNIYANMIAGRLPVGSASAQKVVMNHAYAILGTDRLHAYILERGGHVYYFAVESRLLTSAPGFLLPFSEVLPDRPLHLGDAVYLLNGIDHSVALIVESGSMRLLCNDPDILRDYLIGLDLQVVELEHTVGKPLTSIPQAIHGITERFSGMLMKCSLAVLATMSIIFIAAQAGSAYTLSKNAEGLNVRAVENDLNATLSKLSIQQPLARQVSRIQKVSATVVRSGGWIEQYHMKGETSESFELVLPSWVSQDYLDSLGRDVVTDLRDMEGLLIVRKQGEKEAAK